MPAQNGRDLLLKADPQTSGSFTTIAGLRTTRLAFNAQLVDVTTRESLGQWRELLANAGLRSASISGAGLMRDAGADEIVRTLFFDGAAVPWQAILPGFGTLEGLFMIAALEFSGEHDGAVSYDLSLASAGQLAFTAV